MQVKDNRYMSEKATRSSCPINFSLELFGDSARWDTRLVPERVDAARVKAVVDALLPAREAAS